ncbi:MAG TPA: DUF5666 domain-containing protein, partial [Rhodothermales bacterium]
AALMVLLPVQGALAQPGSNHEHRTRITLSASADFSTTDHVFDAGDSIYVLVEAPALDPVSIVENKYEVEARHGDGSAEGVLTNNLDGTYTTALAAADLHSNAAAWHIEAELQDAMGRTVRGEANFVIRKDGLFTGLFRIHGEVESVGDRFIVIGGREIHVTDRTKILGRLAIGGGIDLNRLVGEIVTVLVHETPQGLEALIISVGHDGDDDDSDRRLIIAGEITAIADSVISVDGYRIRIDGATKAQWRGHDFDVSSLLVGMVVSVHVVPADDGSLLARLIVVEDLGRTQVTVRGEISAIEGDVVVIAETRFRVDENTHLFKGGVRVRFEDLEVGQQAKAVLIPAEDGSYVALVVLEEMDRPDTRILITGRIEELAGDAMVVGGLRIRVNDETEIHNRKGDPIPFSALQVGDVVRVYAVHEAGTGLLAKLIVAKTRVHAYGRIHGEVTAIGDSALVVEDVRFRVERITAFRGGLNGLEDLEVGQHVLVHFVVLADGSRLALMVAARPNPDEHFVFRGAVDSVASDLLVVAGTRLGLTAETQIVDAHGNPITPDQLAEGMYVRVHATSAPDGGLTAVRVKVLESLVLLAPIESTTGNELRIAGRTILLTDETLIVGRNNEVLSRASLQAGAEIEVVAVSEETAGKSGSETALVADHVLVTGNATATGVEDDAALPGGFVLEQNYPNPFNPTTTIAFDITHAQPVHTSLTVFNLLGQRVATLVSGVLEPGKHQVQWSAVNDGGSRIASGVYLYRLEIGGKAETRSMILLK